MRLIIWLGYAGLIPFLGLNALSLWPVIPNLAVLELFSRYSAIILAFMAGVVWPIWLQQTQWRTLALFAVSLPILSFLAGFLPSLWVLWVQLLLFIVLRVGEARFGLDERYPLPYLQLRRRLTWVVVSSHALMIMLWWPR
jgi:hypothetical protein